MSKVFIAAFFLSLTACNWIQTTSAGENVRSASAAEVGNCTRLGRTTAQTMDRIILQRGGSRMQEELLVLARNEAAEMNGNTIVPETVITDGEQTFAVYDCP